MSYSYQLNEYYKINQDKLACSWPCYDDPTRTITLFSDDVLTKNEDEGTYFKETGIGCFGIVINENDLVLYNKPLTLTVL